MDAERPSARAAPRNRTGAPGAGVGAGGGIGVGDGVAVGEAVGRSDGDALDAGGLGDGSRVSAHATMNAAGVSAPSWRSRRREIRAGSGPLTDRC
jgi:hypothetical protein